MAGRREMPEATSQRRRHTKAQKLPKPGSSRTGNGMSRLLGYSVGVVAKHSLKVYKLSRNIPAVSGGLPRCSQRADGGSQRISSENKQAPNEPDQR